MRAWLALILNIPQSQVHHLSQEDWQGAEGEQELVCEGEGQPAGPEEAQAEDVEVREQQAKEQTFLDKMLFVELMSCKLKDLQMNGYVH